VRKGENATCKELLFGTFSKLMLTTFIVIPLLEWQKSHCSANFSHGKVSCLESAASLKSTELRLQKVELFRLGKFGCGKNWLLKRREKWAGSDLKASFSTPPDDIWPTMHWQKKREALFFA